ncbi:MAG: glycosyltransferase family 39 protein [Saprospiraceae bacterium]
MKSEFFQNKSVYILLFGIFICLISPNLLSEGMFMDGTIYATLGRNLAEGLGTFWNPHFSLTHFDEFHEHPPLAFAFLSIFYLIFGDHLIIEKLYSFSTILIQAMIIHWIWKEIQEDKNSWLAILLWLFTPIIIWTSTNNMLENSLMIFCSLSVLNYLYYLRKGQFIYLLLSGLMLSMGFLVKGPVALFPLTFPFFNAIFLQKENFLIAIKKSFFLGIIAILPLILIYQFSTLAHESLDKYYNKQIVRSLSEIVTVKNRFQILVFAAKELVPSIIILLIFYFQRKRPILNIQSESFSHLKTFIACGLTGVVPIMISLKQSNFYLIPSTVFFSIGLALLFSMILKLNPNGISIYKNLQLPISLFVLSIGIFLCVMNKNRISRDQTKIRAIKEIISIIPKNTILQTCSENRYDYSLEAYFARYHKVCFDDKNQHEFILSSAICKNFELPNYAQQRNISSTEFQLYQVLQTVH